MRGEPFRREVSAMGGIASSLGEGGFDLLGQTWLSHGAVTNADDALSIGLNIDYRNERENEWQASWRLDCEMRLLLNRTPRSYSSQTMRRYNSSLYRTPKVSLPLKYSTRRYRSMA